MNNILEKIISKCDGRLAIYLNHEDKHYCPVYKVGDIVVCEHHYQYNKLDCCSYYQKSIVITKYTRLDNNFGDC